MVWSRGGDVVAVNSWQSRFGIVLIVVLGGNKHETIRRRVRRILTQTALDVVPEDRRLRPTPCIAWCNGILVQFCSSDRLGDDGVWIKVPVIANSMFGTKS